MQICSWEDSSAAQECDVNASVCGEAEGVWSCLSCPWSRAAAVVAHVGQPCRPTELGLYLLQALTKTAASPLCQMALALWLGIPRPSYQYCAGLHIAVGWMFEVLLQKGELTQQLRSALCSQKLLGTFREEILSPDSMYIADSMDHFIYIGQKVFILLYETMQLCFKRVKIVLKIVLASSHLHITSQFKVLQSCCSSHSVSFCHVFPVIWLWFREWARKLLNQIMAWQFNSLPWTGLGAFWQSLRKTASVQLQLCKQTEVDGSSK